MLSCKGKYWNVISHRLAELIAALWYGIEKTRNKQKLYCQAHFTRQFITCGPARKITYQHMSSLQEIQFCTKDVPTIRNMILQSRLIAWNTCTKFHSTTQFRLSSNPHLKKLCIPFPFPTDVVIQFLTLYRKRVSISKWCMYMVH